MGMLKQFSAFTLPMVWRAASLSAASRVTAGNLGESVMNIYFPHPTVQAMFLLDETENDISAAIELALTIATKEDIGDVRYWFAVADALTANGQGN
jgi:hypothetical protein